MPTNSADPARGVLNGLDQLLGPGDLSRVALICHATTLAINAIVEREAYRADVVCTDEFILHPDPYPSREARCWARLERTAELLAAIPPELPTILISDFPLRNDVVFLPQLPPFSLWCGTTQTEHWHLRFRAVAVVYGHLHTPRTSWRDGVRFEEVSLSNDQERAVGDQVEIPLRLVMPQP